MQPDCPMCQKWLEQGARFCASCGKPRIDFSPPANSRPTAVVFSATHDTTARTPPFFRTTILVSALLVTLIIANNTFLTIFFFGDIVDSWSGWALGFGLTYGFGDVLLFRYSGTGVAVVFGICIIAEALCLGYAVYRLIDALNREKTQNDGFCVERSGLPAASSSLCVSLILSVILLLIAAMSGNSADTGWMSEYSDLQMLFLLTKAGLEEEILLRVVWIGIPMAALAIIINKDRRSWQYLMGGFGMSKTAFALIVFSSVLFGLAHLSGWGWGKVPDAIMSGLIFGYLYTEYGLYAAVIAHTANDTLSSLLYTFGEGIEVAVMLLLLALGLVILIYWILKLSGSRVDVSAIPLFPGKLETGLLGQWKRH